MFRAHINNVDHYIKFTLEEVKDNSPVSFDCAGCKEEDRSLEVEVYRKPTPTGQYLLSRHPQQHKLGVIRIMNHISYQGQNLHLQYSTGPSTLRKQVNTLPDLDVNILPSPGTCDPIDLMGNPFK